MSDKLTQPNEQTADSTAEPSAAPTAEATGASAEVNANGHLLPCNWKGTIALIWSGQAASILATCAATFAALWYITTTENSALLLAAAGVAALLPTALLSPFGGVIADRFNRKYVMIAADGIAGAFSLVLALLMLAGMLSTWLLLLLLTVRSAAQAFHGTSLMALMPELVPERDMVRINTLDQSLTSASAIVGPVLGIALYTMLGFVAVLVMDAICAALACVCLAFAKLPYAQGHGVSSGSVAKDLAHGLSILRGEPGIKPLLLLVVVAMLLFLPLGTLSPLMTYNWFGGDGYAASGVEAAAGIGLLIGSLFMLVWGWRQTARACSGCCGRSHRSRLHCGRSSATIRFLRLRGHHRAHLRGHGGLQRAYPAAHAETHSAGVVWTRHGHLRIFDGSRIARWTVRRGPCS